MAANTDLLKKLSRRWVGQIGAGGVADASTTTIPLASSTNLATDTAVVATIDRVDSSGTATPALEETIIGVVSGSNLTSCTRGVEGTAQAHSAGAVVEILVTAKGWNDLVDHLLVQHNQLGYHTNITACNITASGTSTLPNITASGTITATGNQTLSHITASDVSSRYYGGTGIKDEDNMASDSATHLATQQSIKAYVDTSVAAVASTTGWITVSDTWTYASASTFTISGVDRTSIYTKGTKLKFTQTSAKYAIVVSSSFSTDTTVTIAVNTDYTIANAAITSPYYSYQVNPQGYPEWFTFTTTFTGFSADPTPATFEYAVQGRICYINHTITNNGTSNATGYTITLPFVANRTLKIQNAGRGTNNGVIELNPIMVSLTASSATATLLLYNEGTWNSAAANKSANLQFFYEI